MLRGGKVIGQGGQACVLRPSVERSLKQPNNFVTKIERAHSARAETTVALQLARLDPQARYGIYATGAPDCMLDVPVLLRAEGVRASKSSGDKCEEIAASRKGEYCAFSMPVFKHDLDGRLPRVAIKALLAGLLNLWHGLVFFHSHDIVHGDIKGPNIAYRAVKGPSALAFTDWGWSANISDCRAALGWLESMKDHRIYTPTEFGGDRGIWAPIMWETKNPDCNMAKKLLKFNDAFSLAYMQMDVVRVLLHNKKVSEAKGQALHAALKNIVYNQAAYLSLGTVAIVNGLEPLFR